MEGQLKLIDAAKAAEVKLNGSFLYRFGIGPALGFDHANAKARVHGAGQNLLSWISLSDVAQFAVACLDNPAARKRHPRSWRAPWLAIMHER